MHNKIDATLSNADKADIKAALAQIHSKLPFLQGIATNDRKSMGWVMSVNAREFCERLLVQAKDNQQFLSSNVDLVAYERDVQLKKDLHELQSSVAMLQSMIADTHAVLQAECAQQALYIYKQLKIAADVGVANEASVANLKSLMPRQGKRNKKTV